ncbi:hypothetical protein DOY81_009490 [Sarcophaga bullata]|nr:hypothetical protein DOY81_009490 [Sarcophaga bullata]
MPTISTHASVCGGVGSSGNNVVVHDVMTDAITNRENENDAADVEAALAVVAAATNGAVSHNHTNNSSCINNTCHTDVLNTNLNCISI